MLVEDPGRASDIFRPQVILLLHDSAEQEQPSFAIVSAKQAQLVGTKLKNPILDWLETLRISKSAGLTTRKARDSDKKLLAGARMAIPARFSQEVRRRLSSLRVASEDDAEKSPTNHLMFGIT